MSIFKFGDHYVEYNLDDYGNIHIENIIYRVFTECWEVERINMEEILPPSVYRFLVRHILVELTNHRKNELDNSILESNHESKDF